MVTEMIQMKNEKTNQERIKEQEGVKAIRRTLVFELKTSYNLDDQQVRRVLNMTDDVIKGILDDLETEEIISPPKPWRQNGNTNN